MRAIAAIVFLLALLVGVSSYFLSRPVFDESLSDSAFSGMSVAPGSLALTLARNQSGAILLVIDLDAEGITAVDVSAAAGREFEDALQAFNQLGTTGLHAMYESSMVVELPWRQLDMPLLPRYPHVAAGTNYSEHAREVGHEGEPFLFPKLSAPTPWNSAVKAGTRLDYEVELCAVTLSEHTPADPAELGYLLCGDFTDRWLLVRDIDLDGEMGRTGFPLAKGGDSLLPIGALLVIPGDEEFYRRIELSLYVDDVLRQKDGAGKMIWSPRQILSRTLADCRTPYQMPSGTIYIADCERIPAGTLLLTGTPQGVLFHPGTLWNPWVYLRKGDVVTSFGTYLGYMQNQIGEQ